MVKSRKQSEKPAVGDGYACFKTQIVAASGFEPVTKN
jgi:hypothetical protein